MYRVILSSFFGIPAEFLRNRWQYYLIHLQKIHCILSLLYCIYLWCLDSVVLRLAGIELYARYSCCNLKSETTMTNETQNMAVISNILCMYLQFNATAEVRLIVILQHFKIMKVKSYSNENKRNFIDIRIPAGSEIRQISFSMGSHWKSNQGKTND